VVTKEVIKQQREMSAANAKKPVSGTVSEPKVEEKSKDDTLVKDTKDKEKQNKSSETKDTSVPITVNVMTSPYDILPVKQMVREVKELNFNEKLGDDKKNEVKNVSDKKKEDSSPVIGTKPESKDEKPKVDN
jgi:hypothetical protein